MECVIRNKNIDVAYFDSDRELNKLTYFIFLNKDKAPLYLQRGGDLLEWLKSRVSAEYRGSVNEILRRLLQTHGVSLKDTFYIKCDFVPCPWESVSPYSDRMIDISSVGLENDFKVSADDTIGGSFEKRWVSDYGISSILKYGTGKFARNSDNEPECEYLAYTLAKYLGLDTCEYDFAIVNDRPATICHSFCSEDIGIVTLYELGYNPSSYIDLYNIALKNGWSTDYIVGMALLDFLTVNIDRHLENIGLFIKNATQSIIKFTPMYDYNLALLPYYTADEGPLEGYLGRSEYSKAYLGDSWEDIARWLKGAIIVPSKVQLAKKFKFSSSLGSCDRCAIANEILANRLELMDKV